MRTAAPTKRRPIWSLLALLALLCAGIPGAQRTSGAAATPPLPAAASEPASPPTPAAATTVGRWVPASPLADPAAVNAIVMTGPALAPNTKIVMATDDGAYLSRNGGSSWADWSEGLPLRSVEALVYGGGTFYALSNGMVYRRRAVAASWASINAGLSPAPGIIGHLALSGDGALFAADGQYSTPTPTLRHVFRYDPAEGVWKDFSVGLPLPADNYYGIVALSAGATSVAISVDGGIKDTNAIFVSGTGAAAWQDITGSLPLKPQSNTAGALSFFDDTLYAGLGGANGGVWRYTEGVWSDISGAAPDPNVAGLAISSLAAAPNEALFAASGGDFYAAVDRAATGAPRWVKTESGIFPLAIAPSPTVASTPTGDGVVLVGTSHGALRSIDGGGSFSAANVGLGLSFAAHTLVFADDSTLFAAGRRGTYRSTNMATSWTNLRQAKNYPISAFAPSANFKQDGTALNLQSEVEEAANLAISRDRGATWTPLLTKTGQLGSTPQILLSSPDILRDNTFFATSLGTIGERNNQTKSVARSTDRGASWQRINAGLLGHTLFDLAIAPNAGAGAFPLAGTDAGVFRFNGASWEAFNGGDLAASTPVNAIAYSPQFARDGALFAVGSGGLFRYAPSPNPRWNRIAAEALPIGEVRALVVSPNFAADQTLFAGTTTRGVWMSSDGGATWGAINRGLPSLEVLALAASPNLASDHTLLVSTAGAGIFKYTLPPPAPPWLVLLYLAGDDIGANGLSEPIGNLVSRLGGLENPNVRVVTLFDGNQAGDSRIYLREPGAPGLEVVRPPPTLPGSEWDTGSVATLQNFIRWALDTYPGSRHTMLSIVDHGGGWSPDLGEGGQSENSLEFESGGWRGMSLDTTSNSSLSTKNTGQALDQALDDGERFDIIFFDACLMAMTESLYEVQRHADYLIAGENLLWAALPYERYLAPDSLKASTTAPDLAQRIVETYNSGVGQGYPFVIGAFDAHRLAALPLKVDALAALLLQNIDNNNELVYNAIVAAYEETQKFDYDVSLRLDKDKDGYVDLSDFAQKLAQKLDVVGVPLDLHHAASAIATAIGGRAGDPSAIVLGAARRISGTTRYAPDPWQFDNAYGLSIYLPLGERDCRPTGPIDGADDGDCIGSPSVPGRPALEPQLRYYTDPNQLAFTRDAPHWAALLTELDRRRKEQLPDFIRDLGVRPLHSPTLFSTQWRTLLPFVSNTSAPVDVAVDAIEALPANPQAGQPAELRVTVTNRGPRDVTTPFWVDLYVDPGRAPQPNDLWPQLCQYGAAWRIYSLGAGESRVLSTRSANDPRGPGQLYSNFEAFIRSGAHRIYALADSYAEGQPGGVLVESDETNNVYGPVVIQVNGGQGAGR